MFTPKSREKCPYCQTTVLFESPVPYATMINFENQSVNAYRTVAPDEELYTIPSFCPNCYKTILTLLIDSKFTTIWPLASAKPPAPKAVPQNMANDFNEASLILQFSPKASAALSRRCLQSVLSDAGGSNKKDLSKQIDDVIPNLPSTIASNLDYMKEIGNFAAHEQKSINTGAILDVEPLEAEWNLDVLETLFDYYYVRPEIEKKKREDFNKKVLEAGRDSLD